MLTWILRRLPGGRRGGTMEEGSGVALSASTQGMTRIRADNPIRRLEDDVLGRAKAAHAFAEQVQAFDAAEGLVVGVLGPWGSGKTSFVNLARERLSDLGVTVLDFNPWMFSGAEQLVESFFIELAAQLKVKPGLAELGKRLEDYGEAFSGLGALPLVGPWIEGGRAATSVLGRLLQSRKQGVAGRRSRLEAGLKELDKPIVVVLDDIDRLTTVEIRDIFKLVRLTASFPNVIYLVAFDRERVEKALEEQGLPGRAYLEKIVQLGVDLPVVPAHVLNTQVFDAIEQALTGLENPGQFDASIWPDVFMEVVRPLIKNMRDVRRYAATLSVTTRELDGQVALADVLGLEAVRVFLPDVYNRLHSAVDALTTTYAIVGGGSREQPHLQEQVKELLEAAGDDSGVVRSLVERLFPAATRHIGGSSYGPDWKGRWLRERRVAHEDILRYYLERVAGQGLQAFTDAEQAWARMDDGPAFDSYLRSLAPERQEDVIASLEAYEDEFGPQHVVPGSVVLLNLLPDLPERPRGMFDFGSRLVVGRVVYRLVRKLEDPAAIEAAVREIIPQVTTLSSKWELINTVGYRENVGHKLVSETAASQFERELRAEVSSAAPTQLAREADLLRIMVLTKREGDSEEPPLDVPSSPEVTLALLKAARSESIGQSMGSRAIRRSARLSWELLVELYGDEETLRIRINELEAEGVPGSEELLELASKYAAGWRPSDFGDE